MVPVPFEAARLIDLESRFLMWQYCFWFATFNSILLNIHKYCIIALLSCCEPLSMSILIFYMLTTFNLESLDGLCRSLPSEFCYSNELVNEESDLGLTSSVARSHRPRGLS